MAEKPIEPLPSDGSARTIEAGSRDGFVLVRYTSGVREAVCLAEQGGIGLAVVPGFLNALAMAEGRLVRVLPDWSPASIRIAVLYRA